MAASNFSWCSDFPNRTKKTRRKRKKLVIIKMRENYLSAIKSDSHGLKNLMFFLWQRMLRTKNKRAGTWRTLWLTEQGFVNHPLMVNLTYGQKAILWGCPLLEYFKTLNWIQRLCSPNSPFLTFFCHLLVSAVAFFSSCLAFLYS